MSSSKRRKFNIALDVFLLLAFLLLLSPRLTGLPLHEVLGLIVFIPVIAHLLSSWQWIQLTSTKIFTATKPRARINYFINAILFILVVVVIVSGFFISEIIVPAAGMNIVKDTAWRAVHVQTTTFVMLFSGLHIAINLDWIVSLFKKRLRLTSKKISPQSNNVVQTVRHVSILLITALIITSVLISLVGMPTLERLYSHSYIKEYMPTLKNGLG